LHDYAGIVIANTFGYKSEKVECSDVGFKKGFGAFSGKGHHEHGIGMNQAHHKEYDLLQDTVKLDHGMTKVHLSLAGLLAQRHEHFFGSLFDPADRILDNGVASGKSFLLQKLPDLYGGVMLLAGHLLVSLDDSLYAIKVWPNLWSAAGYCSSIARRLAVVPDFP
jgi:hypothetical protein